MENIKLLFQLYFRPAGAMSDIIDKGGWLFAAALVLFVSFAFYLTVNTKLDAAYTAPDFKAFYQPPPKAETGEEETADQAAYDKAFAQYQKAAAEKPAVPLAGDKFFRFFSFAPGGFYQPVITISVFYVPAAILLMSLFGGTGSFGLVLRRDYGALATCSLMAYAAGVLPFALAGILLYGQNIPLAVLLGMWFGACLLFGFFMIFALRTVLGANYAAAILTVCVAWLAFTVGMYVFRNLSPWLFSPFLLFYAYMYFGGRLSGEVRGFGNAFRQRQNFKRFLHNATVNPRDADAHVQLALIYLQRKQDAKAMEHLRQAFAIDPEEIDANYELGKIARRKNELQQALDHFSVVVEQNDKHNLSEIWREVGATYLDAGMLKEAREALETFTARRPFDTEGLYYFGRVLKALGEHEKAREAFQQAVESAKTSPGYRRHEIRQWGKLAQKEI
jgi:predicted negative regulator of RcsB-dependent stress response